MSPSALNSQSNKASSSKPSCENDTSEVQEPAFVCTICWQNQPLGSKPKLLGTSARIVCHSCWCAVLDLSICWVCGECIVRGDEAVSLGWCFWHRSCFGCLFCKTKMSIPKTENREDRHNRRGVGVMDGSEDGTGSVTGDEVRRCVGVELEEVPLCSLCKVETAGGPDDHVFKKGLEMVTMSDGGLGRDRLDMLDEKMAPRRTADSRTSAIGMNLTRCINNGVDIDMTSKMHALMTDGAHLTDGLQTEGEAALVDNAIHTVYHSKDGNLDGAKLEDHTHSDREEAEIGSFQTVPVRDDVDEDIYFSIFDPLGQPAFKPSKTKPLPQWMRFLPSNVHREHRQPGYILRAKSLESLRSLHELQTVVPNTPIAIEAFANSLETSTYSTRFATAITSPATESPGTVTPPEVIHLTLIKTGSKMRFNPTDTSNIPASIGDPESPERSDSLDGFSSEIESEDERVTQRLNTPFPRISRPPLMQSETSSYFNHCLVVEPRTIHESLDIHNLDKPPTPPLSPEKSDKLTQRIARWRLPGPPARDSRLLSQSCEYLEECQPTLTKTTYRSKHVPKEPEPILEKIRKQIDTRKRLAHEMNRDQKTEDSKEVGGSKRGSNIAGCAGVDPRNNLRQELRNLFYEE